MPANKIKGEKHGKKRRDEERERAMAQLAAGVPVVEIAKNLNIPESTLRSWRKRLENPQNEKDKAFADERQKYIESLCKSSAEGAQLAAELIKERIRRSDKAEREIESVIYNILQSGEGEPDSIELLCNLKISGYELNGAFSAFAKQAAAENGEENAGITLNIVGAKEYGG